jgi:hypothetical protein
MNKWWRGFRSLGRAVGSVVALAGPASKVSAGSILGQVWFNDQIKLAQSPAPYGHTLGEWSALWQQWSLGQPLPTNPNFDLTGDQAGNGQVFPVYFMPSTIASGNKTLPQDTTIIAKRRFTVPGNRPIFVFISGVVADNACVDLPRTVDRLRAEAQEQIAPFRQVHLTIDGHPVVLGGDRDLETDVVLSTPLSAYRASSPPFSFTLPVDNIRQESVCNTPGTISPAVTEGWAVMLPPLLDGQHTIRFGASYGAPTNFSFDVENLVTAVRQGDED